MTKEKVKNENKGNNKKLVLVIAIAMLLVATVGATFAYFASRAEINNTLNVVANIENNNGSFITKASNIELNVTSASMQESVANNVAVSNTGVLNVEYLSGSNNGITCKYDINYEWVSENETNPYTITNILKDEFTYEITDGSNTIISERNFVASSNRNKQRLGTGYIYNASTETPTIKTYNINAKFYNIDEDQRNNADKNWNIKFYADNVVCGVDVESTFTLSGVLLDENNNPVPNGLIMTHSEARYTKTDSNGAFTISGLENEGHDIYYIPNNSIVGIIDLTQNEINEIPGLSSGTFDTSNELNEIPLTNNYKIQVSELDEVPISSNNNGNNSGGNNNGGSSSETEGTLLTTLKSLAGTNETNDFGNWAIINQEVSVSDDIVNAYNLSSNTYVNTIYTGANPNNYVHFNGYYENDLYYGYYSNTSSSYKEYTSLDECKSASSYNKNCTKIHLAGDPELWRIIGIFNEDSHGKSGQQLLKIIKNESLGNFIWDYKQNGVGSGYSSYGSYEWSDSQLMFLLNGSSAANKGKLYDGSPMSEYTTSVSGNYIVDKNGNKIMRIDNGNYLTENREENKKIYKPSKAEKLNGLTETTGKLSSTLSSTSQNMIEEVTWHLGGPDTFNDEIKNTPTSFYVYERGNQVCGTIKDWSGSCTPSTTSTIRSTTWEGKIGLMYPSDYGYATNGGSTYDRSTCLNYYMHNWYTGSYKTDCAGNSWLWYDGASDVSIGISKNQRTITPSSYSYCSTFNIHSSESDTGNLTSNIVNTEIAVRPTVYLKQNVKITSGDGSYSSPYELTM